MAGAWVDLWDHLTWMSPSLGLALVVSLVVALAYAVLAGSTMRALPIYWSIAVAGFAGGQALAADGMRWLQAGDLALGTGVAVCGVLFAGVSLVKLWYTGGSRMRSQAEATPMRRERVR